jgi:hypothetical protein
MPLAAILGSYLLLPWLPASIAPSIPVLVVWQSTQSQENQPSSSATQHSSTQPPDQQKVPDQSATPSTTPASSCAENSAGTTVKPDCKPAASTGAKAKKRHRTQKTVAPASPPAGTDPPKKVVRNGGTDDPVVDLSPRRNPQQTSQQTDNTKQLLAASDTNLNKVSGRPLSANQQDTVKQIKSYMEQAKGALNEGDVQRAYNLALKANLLSAELVGH